MREKRNILAMSALLVALALGMSSCGTSLTLALGGGSGAALYVDDLYGVHDIAAMIAAEKEAAEREAAAKAERERQIAAMIAAANAEADIDDILGDVGGVESVESPAGSIISTQTGDVNLTYNNIYVDDYASAYARRLQGFTSMTYRLPSSYWDYRYGDAYFLTLAYDPAFYTVMVMGDQVWVEPRYITSMFGSWNNPYYYNYHYGYNPYYYGYSYGYWDYWGWNSPYWGCNPYYYNPYYYCGPHHHYPHHKPQGPGGPHGEGGHKKPNVTHRPSYGAGGGSSSMRPGGGVLSYGDRLGGVRDESRGGTQIAHGNSGTSARPSTGRGGSTLRGGSTSTRAEEGKTTPTLNRPTSKDELTSSLNGTTINPTQRPLRGGGTSGVSNSTSRTSRGTAVGTRSSGSSSSSNRTGVSSSSSSSRRSPAVRVQSGSSSNNRTSSSVGSKSSGSRSSSRATTSSRSSSSSNRSSTRVSSSSSSSSSRSSSSSVGSFSSSRSSSSSSSSSSSRSSSRGGR